MRSDLTTTPIAAKEIAQTFDSNIAGADELRAAALTGLQRLRIAKAKHAQREQKSLIAELGENDPQVLQLQARIAADESFARGLGAEIDRAKAGVPEVDKNGWVLYGHVRNGDLQGLPKLTVALFDRNGRWVDTLGYACTDDSGYFELRYSPAADVKSARIDTQAAATGQTSGWFIRVSDSKKNVLYQDKAETVPQAGQCRYREIIVEGTGDACVPPEATKAPGLESKPEAGTSTPSSARTLSRRPTKKPKR